MTTRRCFSGALSTLALSLTLAWPMSSFSHPTAPALAADAESDTVAKVVKSVIASGDNKGLPFIVIDKVGAQVFLFAPQGQLKGGAPALLGLAYGDNSAPGVGEKAISDIAPQERTTPAGRYVAAFGPASGGKKVLWVDYATAISLHPVIDTNRAERRPERLLSPTPAEHRITFGCINVPKPFFNGVVRPALANSSAVVYILPEATPIAQIFPSLMGAEGTEETVLAHPSPD